jgi:hypothetical protein
MAAVTHKKEILMKYAKHGFLVLTLALVAGFTAPRAAAQQAYTGTFTLASEAYWGPTLLPAGHYSIIANLDPTSAIHPVNIRGEGVRATVLSGAVMTGNVSTENKLQLQQINGVSVIRELDAGLVGQSFRFTVSKNARGHAEQASASSMTTVPVSTSGAY